jgi:hypothetical protein
MDSVLYKLRGLFVRGAAGPERPEARNGIIDGLSLLLRVIVVEKALPFVPEIVVNELFSACGARKPLC